MNTSFRRGAVAVLAAVACVPALAASATSAWAAGAASGIRPAPAAPGAAVLGSATKSLAPSVVFAYPSSFDLRDEGRVSPVKDQGPYGTCWAFAALGSLESSLLPGETWDFSEDNLLWYSGFDTAGYQGGNSLMAAAYLTRWTGPFTEAQDAYYTADDLAHPAPSTMALQKHVQEVDFLPGRTSAADNDDIKYALTNWGGVYISLFFLPRSPYWTPGTNSYHYNGTQSPNHGVLVVGWDDDYPASDFLDPSSGDSTKPAGDGAFLVKNSYGTSFGDDGYFWLSYYDTVAGADDTTAVFRDAATPGETRAFDRIYQHDPLGYLASMVPDPGDETDWFASRFVATASDDLTAVGFWTLGPQASYRVYAGPSLDLDEMTQVATGSFARTGYHTARFDTPYLLTQGQRFYVAVRLEVPDSGGQAWTKVALEDRWPGYSSAATAGKNQSYISDAGTDWQDLVTLSPAFEHANVCLKAYTGGMDGPHTEVTGADTKWHNTPVALTFAGEAPAGVAAVEYRLDGGATWQTAPADAVQYTVEAPADHSNDGVHTIAYRSVDMEATTEAFHTVAVKIDTQRPATLAPQSASVRRYGYVTLRYRVNDLPTAAGSATVTIRIKTLGGATKKVLRLGSQPTNTKLTKRFHGLLPRRTYRFYVYAVDPAGNLQASIGRNRLTVR